MWKLNMTRQFLRSTVCPYFSADSWANDHCVGSAARPAVLLEAIDKTPQPNLPAICIPDGDNVEAVTTGMLS